MSTLNLFLVALVSTLSVYGEEEESADETLYVAGENDLNDFGVRLYEEGGVPTLAFYDRTDLSNTVYCLEFSKSYEIKRETYNTTYCQEDGYIGEYVDNGWQDFADVDWTYKQCDDSDSDLTDCEFAFYSSSDKWNLLLFKFNYIESNESSIIQSLVKFDIIMENYTWINPDNNDLFSLKFEIYECTDDYTQVADSFENYESGDGDDSKESDDSEDSDDKDSEDDGKTSEEEEEEEESESKDEDNDMKLRKRKLLEDEEKESTSQEDGDKEESTSNDESSEEGSESGSSSSSSEDDSNEIDLDASFFVIEDYANDGEVSVSLCITEKDEDGAVLHVVYSHFDSDLTQDPKFGVDKDDLPEEEEDNDDDGDSQKSGSVIINTTSACAGLVVFVINMLFL